MMEKARHRLIGMHKTDHHIHLIVKIFLCWDRPVVTTHMKQKYIHFFPIHRGLCRKVLSQISLKPIFQSFFFEIPDHPARKVVTALKIVYNYTSDFFLFQAKWITRGTDWSSSHWEDFPWQLPFRDVPERGCSVTAIHFQVVLACHGESSANQTHVFPSSVNWS